MTHTAESVTFAHPDKVCDQISDAILDACLAQDSLSRVAVETVGGHGMITLTGEVTTRADVDMGAIALKTYRSCGYGDSIGVTVNVAKQSPEIAHGVDLDGAGDQGIMIGYATDETPEMLPLEFALARRLTRAMGAHDGKAQVTVQDGEVVRLVTSVCGADAATDAALEESVQKEIAPHVLGGADEVVWRWMRNPNGAWTVGGFEADSGVTGRKIVADAYGPRVAVGGGAFSGKDATKVDRSAAYMARKIAVDYVRRGAKTCLVRLAYAIGCAEPVMALATVDGKDVVIHGYDLRPRAIIEQLDLRSPRFLQTARLGHFGNGFPWDKKFSTIL